MTTAGWSVTQMGALEHRQVNLNKKWVHVVAAAAAAACVAQCTLLLYFFPFSVCWPLVNFGDCDLLASSGTGNVSKALAYIARSCLPSIIITLCALCEECAVCSVRAGRRDRGAARPDT